MTVPQSRIGIGTGLGVSAMLQCLAGESTLRDGGIIVTFLYFAAFPSAIFSNNFQRAGVHQSICHCLVVGFSFFSVLKAGISTTLPRTGLLSSRKNTSPFETLGIQQFVSSFGTHSHARLQFRIQPGGAKEYVHVVGEDPARRRWLGP